MPIHKQSLSRASELADQTSSSTEFDMWATHILYWTSVPWSDKLITYKLTENFWCKVLLSLCHHVTLFSPWIRHSATIIASIPQLFSLFSMFFIQTQILTYHSSYYLHNIRQIRLTQEPDSSGIVGLNIATPTSDSFPRLVCFPRPHHFRPTRHHLHSQSRSRRFAV